MQPLVSVMMPAYNAYQFIGAAIVSMKQQTYENWQLCIVDDGSEDATSVIAQSAANHDGRICVDTILHGGCPVARNACLAMAEGDIIAKLDADDLQDPERLEKQVNHLLETDDDIVSCNMTWLTGLVKVQKKTGPMRAADYMSGKSNGPCCASLVAWRKIYDLVGGYEPRMLAGSDGDWNFRAIIADMKWGHLDGYWYHQRRHPAQLSQAMRVMQRQVHAASREKYAKTYRPKS